jgi:DNA primase
MIIALWQSPDALQYLQGRGLTEEMVLEAQLGLATKGKYAGWLAIPYLDGQGRWRSTRYRTLPPTDKAYRTPKGEGRHLYNVSATEEPVVAICEGEFDSMVMRQLGFPAVALPGLSAWQREWRFLFRNCDLVYVLIDHAPRSKEEARAAETRVRNAIVAQVGMVTDVEPIDLPEGMDVSDLYLQDPDELKGLFE